MNEQNNLNIKSDTSNNEVTNNKDIVIQGDSSSQVKNSNQEDNNIDQMGQKIEQTFTTPPCASDEKEVISTVKQKKKTNILPTLLIIIVLLLGVSYMDKIISFFDKNDNNPIISTPTNNEENYNLVDGFIVINDNSAYMKVKKIKFYNFIKSKNEQMLTLNYISDTNYKITSDLEIYIELYNSEKEILYKEIFDTNDVLIDAVKTYSILLDDDIYNNIKYAKVRMISKEELSSTQKVVCRIKEAGQGYNLLFKNTFNFVNNELQNYEVHKEINITLENTTTKKYQMDILNENNSMINANIETKYENDTLDYTIDVSEDLGTFVPMYKYKTSPAIIKEKEILKNWECE